MGDLLEVSVTTSAERRVFFVVPDSIDDPLRVSGGNIYDRHVRDGLRAAGWQVRMIPVPEITESGDVLLAVPDEAVVIVDGLVAVRESSAMTAHASRLRMIVLAHMVASLLPDHTDHTAKTAEPAGVIDRERAAMRSAQRVITTSEWTRSELVKRALANPCDAVVALPGARLAPMSTPSASGGRLVCVGVVARHKGQDLLVEALTHLTSIEGWTATVVGSLTTEPAFVGELAEVVARASLTDRVSFTGPLTGAELEAAYAAADLVVVPSRSESYGMVVAEALAHGIPVLATDVGGIREALSGWGDVPTDARARPWAPLIPAEDTNALETALREWWSNADVRAELAARAREARNQTRPWSATVAVIESVLREVAHAKTMVSA